MNYDYILDVYKLDIPVYLYNCFVWVQASGLWTKPEAKQ